MLDFHYRAYAQRVAFGSGKIKEIGNEISFFGIQNSVIITTPGKSGTAFAEQVHSSIKERCVGIYAKAIQHVPVESVNEALVYIKEKKVDGIIAVGGGSAVGLAKAVAANTALPIIAIPTTYSGSEMTHIWGQTENGVKTTKPDETVKPKSVIYDTDLTIGLPSKFSLTSGINAMAHCVEALYAEDANPITSIMAEEGIKALFNSLPKVMAEPLNLEARSQALYGAWLAGTVLDTVKMGVHHRLCHTLGGSFNLPHSDVHTVILPYAISYNKNHSPAALEALFRAFGMNENETDAGGYLHDFVKSLGGPTSLKEIGMEKGGIEKAAEIATGKPVSNPRDVDFQSIKNLLDYAYLGKKLGAVEVF